MGASKAEDIHTLIQERQGDFPGMIHQYRDQIDDHVEVCELCRERMVGYASKLPKLLVRATVVLPEPRTYSERIDQLGQLKRGQCLACGCEVLHPSWTPEKADAEFYLALAQALQMTEEQVRRMSPTVRMLSLPLDTRSLRRLRDRFWYPDGASCSEEVRDAEEGDNVLQLPETIGDFITKVLQVNSGVSWVECSEHWCP